MPQTTFSGKLALLRAASGSPPLSGYIQGTNASVSRSQALLSKNLDGNHILLAQISNLVSQLSKRNFRQTSQELTSVRDHYLQIIGGYLVHPFRWMWNLAEA